MGKKSKTHFPFFARFTQSSSRDYANAAVFYVFLLEIASNWSEAAENTITLSVSNGPKWEGRRWGGSHIVCFQDQLCHSFVVVVRCFPEPLECRMTFCFWLRRLGLTGDVVNSALSRSSTRFVIFHTLAPGEEISLPSITKQIDRSSFSESQGKPCWCQCSETLTGLDFGQRPITNGVCMWYLPPSSSTLWIWETWSDSGMKPLSIGIR